MNINKKKYINYFINKENDENKSFALVLEKINDIFLSILNDISSRLNGKVGFKLNLIGEHFLGTNYNFLNPINILIDYLVEDEDLQYSQNRAKKGNIGKLYSDAFNTKNNLVLTIEELTKIFFNELSLNTNITVYRRKNQISLKYLNYNFFVFFVNKNILDNEYDFTIKSKDFRINFMQTHENLLIKNKESNGNFFNLIKFFKVVELELILKNELIFNASKIPYFYENLLYNIPNEIISNEFIYDNFLASFAYLINANLKEFISADNYNLINDFYQLHSKHYITTLDIQKVIQQTKFFINNIDSILSDIED